MNPSIPLNAAVKIAMGWGPLLFRRYKKTKNWGKSEASRCFFGVLVERE
jgi:hypothetical protein